MNLNLEEGQYIKLNGDKSVSVYNGKDENIFNIAAPYMYDAAEAVSGNVDVKITQDGKTAQITYIPDSKWLNDEERVYPIVIDPSVTSSEYSSSIQDTYVYDGDSADGSSNTHYNETKIYAGLKSVSGTYKVHRSYIKITGPKLESSTPVIRASLTFTVPSGTTTGRTFALYKVTGSWAQTTVKWNSQPALGGLLGTVAYSSGTTKYEFNVTSSITSSFVNGGTLSYMLRYSSESTSNPDYNSFYANEETTVSYRPLMKVIYGYNLPYGLASGTVYTFKSVYNSKYLNVVGDFNEANAYTVSGNNANTQKFKLEYVPSTGGYVLRSMASSSGTNRVLDIVKSNGVVASGCNVELYQNIDPIAQEWLIIGAGISQFKLVTRSNPSMALTVSTSSSGTSGGKLITDKDNVYMYQYYGGNSQKWEIYDGTALINCSNTQNFANGTYVINNAYTGRFLLYNGSGVIANSFVFGGSNSGIGVWKLTYIGLNRYLVESTQSPGVFLKNNGTTAILSQLNSGVDVDSTFIWLISSLSSGSSYIMNYISGTEKFLGNTITDGGDYTTAIQVGSYASTNKSTWRIVSSSDYMSAQLSSFSVGNLSLVEDDIDSPVISGTSGKMWVGTNDFKLEKTSGNAYTSIITNNQIQGNSEGTSYYRMTHKPTGMTDTFSVVVSSPIEESSEESSEESGGETSSEPDYYDDIEVPAGIEGTNIPAAGGRYIKVDDDNLYGDIGQMIEMLQSRGISNNYEYIETDFINCSTADDHIVYPPEWVGRYSVLQKVWQINGYGITRKPIVELINHSKVSVILAHGSATGISISGSEDVNLITADIESLPDDYFMYSQLIVLMSCSTGGYVPPGNTTFAQSFIEKGAGAVVYFTSNIERDQAICFEFNFMNYLSTAETTWFITSHLHVNYPYEIIDSPYDLTIYDAFENAKASLSFMAIADVAVLDGPRQDRKLS